MKRSRSSGASPVHSSTSQRQAVDEGMSRFATARVPSHLVHEVLVHDDLAAMRVKVALGELDRLAEHDTHVDLGDGEGGRASQGSLR